MSEVQSRKIGPVTVIFNEGVPDEVMISLEVEDAGDFSKVQVLSTVTPPELRRIVAYCNSLLNTYIKDNEYGETLDRFVSVECERV